MDSDWNEQSNIWDSRLRRITRDILGDFAIPLSSNEITKDNSTALKISDFSRATGGVIDFSIGKGVLYAAGYPVVFPADMTFRTQSDYPEPEIEGEGDDLLVYLDVWSKTLNYIDDPLIRETALGGPDTCLRLKVVAQIRARFTSGIDEPRKAIDFLSEYPEEPLLFTLKVDQSAHQIPIGFGEVDMGGLIPGNLHFRVELHRGRRHNGGYDEGFKWSDENAATVVRILDLGENNALIEETEAVTGEFLKEGDWVEISNEITELHRQGGQMARIENLVQDDNNYIVTFDQEVHPMLRRFKIGGNGGYRSELQPRLRRWSGYFSPLVPKTVYDMGRGIKAVFNSGKGSEFRPGDFWTFALRDREYNKKYAPQKSIPDGIHEFHYPIAVIKDIGGKTSRVIDCRKFFSPLATFSG